MRITEPFFLPISNARMSTMLRIVYATILRCIGQDLERRGLKAFDIRVDGNAYVAECGYQEPPAPAPVSIHYSLDDIDELDRAGEKRRGGALPASDFINQVQIFRTIGGFLDKNESRLVRITNNDATQNGSLLVVEYVTKDGERVVDDRAGSAIYDMCVQMYKQRGKLTGTGSRRRR